MCDRDSSFNKINFFWRLLLLPLKIALSCITEQCPAPGIWRGKLIAGQPSIILSPHDFIIKGGGGGLGMSLWRVPRERANRNFETIKNTVGMIV